MQRIYTIALAIASTMPIVAQAQGNYAPDAGNLMYSGDQTTNGTIVGIKVGPYKAQLKDFAPTLSDVLTPGFASIWSVDYSHQAPSTDSWDTYYATAFETNSIGSDGNGDFSKTRAYAAAFGKVEEKHSAAGGLYQKAAWLIEQYDPTKDGMSGAGLYNAINIQGSIWNLLGAGPSPTAGNFFQLFTPWNATTTADWFVLSDKASSGESTSNTEFLTYRARPVVVVVPTEPPVVPTEPSVVTEEPTITTPEPSAYALMAAGLLALGLVARRRRVEMA